MRSPLIFIAVLFVAAGCGVASEAQSSAEATDSISVSSSLTAEYDARRVKRCLGDFNGQPGWSTTAHYTLNGGPKKMLAVAGLFPSGTKPAVIPLDTAGTLEIWFETTSRWGCQEWDSDFGRNYRLELSSDSISSGR